MLRESCQQQGRKFTSSTRSAVSGPSSHGVPWSRKVWSLPIRVTGRGQHNVMGIAPHEGIRAISLLCRYKALWPQTSYVSSYLVSHLRTGRVSFKAFGRRPSDAKPNVPWLLVEWALQQMWKARILVRRRVLQTLSDTDLSSWRTQTKRKLASL